MATFESMTRDLGGMDPFDAPVPGQSLTANPSAKAPYEQPPSFTDKDEAIEEIFMRLTDENNIDEFLDLMRMGTPVEYIAQTILFEGFRSGQFTPDVMLLLIEPTIYLLLYLADYGNIDNVVLAPEIGEPTVTGNISMDQSGTISVGEEQIARPESVTPSLLEEIKGAK